jgi:hypothetical protein
MLETYYRSTFVRISTINFLRFRLAAWLKAGIAFLVETRTKD